MKKINQNGFSVVEGIIVVAVVAVIALVGWRVIKNHNKPAKSTQSSTTKTVTPEPSSPTPSSTSAPQGNYVNVVQADNQTVVQLSPEKIAKTADQALILQALHETCKDPQMSNVTVNTIVFDGNSNFKQDGNYAFINASVCSSAGDTVDKIGHGGSAHLLHKETDKWVSDFSTQMILKCSDVDGKGYPATIIPTCDDNNTERAPR